MFVGKLGDPDRTSGWTSTSGAPPDSDPVTRHRSAWEQGAGLGRVPQVVPLATDACQRYTEVDPDEACKDVARAFDFDFGSKLTLHLVRPEA